MKSLIIDWIKSYYLSDKKAPVEALLANEDFIAHQYWWMLGTLVASVLFFAFIWWLTKEIILSFVVRLAKKTKTNFDDLLVENKFFNAISHLIPLMFLDYFFSIIFLAFPQMLDFSVRITEVLIVFVILVSLKRFMRTIGGFLAEKPTFSGKPIGAYVQTINIVLTILLGVVMVSLLTKQSPTFFLTSLGAMTAIILLVFKDSILGFVGSIQIATNDMVRIGDWVSMEKYGADGDVIQINLTTVKVQNWDKTITTIPTYAFVSDSFKNWRGMSESGGRRIKRSISIQIDTIRFASPELIDRLSNVKMLSSFIAQREEEIENYNQLNKLDQAQINARRQTNVGLFRRYLEYYIKHHERIHQEMTIMVRQLQSSEKGLPIEVYCFTNTIAWGEYEEIMSDIFDHIFAVVNEFDLAIHEEPTNAAIQKLVNR